MRAHFFYRNIYINFAKLIVFSAYLILISPSLGYADAYSGLTNDINDKSKPWFPVRNAPLKGGEIVRDYTLVLGGLVIGSAHTILDINKQQDDYDLQIDIVPAQLLRLFTTYRLNAHSSGSINKGNLIKEKTELRTLGGEKRKIFNFQYEDGELVANTSNPPVDPADNRVPVPAEVYKRAMDITDIFLLKRKKNVRPMSPKQCSRTINFFDGYAHSELRFFYYDSLVYDRPSRGTKVLECRGNWKSIAGYKPNKIPESRLEGRNPVRMYITYDEKTNTMLPVRIQMNLLFGIAVLRHDYE